LFLAKYCGALAECKRLHRCVHDCHLLDGHSFIHSFITEINIAPLQGYYSEAVIGNHSGQALSQPQLQMVLFYHEVLSLAITLKLD